MRARMIIALLFVAGCPRKTPPPWSSGSCLVGDYRDDGALSKWCVYEGSWWWCIDNTETIVCHRAGVATPPPIPAEKELPEKLPEQAP